MNEFTEKLIRQAAAGNQEAITELYELTYSSVYKTVRAMVQDEDTVLDIVQDSYIKGFQSLDQLDAPENFRAWMKRIATNKAKDHLKKRKPILFSEMANEDGEEIDFLDDCLDHCPEEVLDRQETTRLMNEILGTLSEEQRLVIGMFYYEELSVREIAEILGCSENTVKSRLNYGRKKVEVQVRELEKKGTKLYSLAPLPFLLWLFRMDAQAAEMPSMSVWSEVTAACADPAAAASGAGAKTAARAGGRAAAKAGAKTAAKAGGKALATKILAGVLAVGVVGGSAAAAVSSLTREKSRDEVPSFSAEAWEENRAENPVDLPDQTLPEGTETTEPATPVIGSPDVAYFTVMDQYLTALSMDSNEYEEAYYADALDGIHNGDHQAIRYYHMFHEKSFYTTRIDLDGNGVEELLVGIGSSSEPQSGDIVDVYSFDGTKAVQLIDEPTLGDRSQLYLREDGSFYLHGGNGVMAGDTNEYYKVQGCELVSVAPSEVPDMQLNWQFLGGTEPLTIDSAYEVVANEILAACDADDNEWINGYVRYSYEYANLSSLYDYHLFSDFKDPYFMARHDLDGNGTEELFIGHGTDPSNAYIVGIYGYDGWKAVNIQDTYAYEVLADGTVLEVGNGYIAGKAYRIGPDGYTLEETSLNIQSDGMLSDADLAPYGGKLRLNWEPLSESSAEPASAGLFDKILEDVQTVVNTIPSADYQNNQSYYDSQYPHLGRGVLWTLTFQPINGYSKTVWKTYYDADNDGQDELCIGTQFSPNDEIMVLSIYKQNGDVIEGDMVYNYPLPQGQDSQGNSLAGWEYLCG